MVLQYLKKVLMTGNDAIARGLIEAGVRVAAAYPGTPSSELLKSVIRFSEGSDVHVEWAVNEKVAFEVAFAASLCDLRSVAIMKHLGTHWALDPLAVSAVTGVKGGLLVVSADDPGPQSSQSSADTRNHAKLAHILAAEPSDPMDAKQLVKHSFTLSEKVGLPLLFRYTSRIAHGSGVVPLGEISKPNKNPHFERDPSRFVSIAPNARRNIPKTFEKLDRAEQLVSRDPWVRREGPETGKLGIIACGVSYHYVKDALSIVGMENEVPVLRLSISNPIPKGPILDFISAVDSAVLVEELDPIIEREVFQIAHLNGVDTTIYGKGTGHFSPYGEYNIDKVLDALSGILGLDFRIRRPRMNKIERRIPQMCAGCGHRGAYISIKGALRKFTRGNGGVVLGDRGCYNQGANPPLRAIDTAIAMGSSIAMAVGMAKSGVEEPLVAVIGDSTFFHGGIPPLIDAWVQRAPVVVAILDNRWTCMTGHEPNPGTGIDARGNPAPVVYPEKIVKGIGIDFVKVVDPYDIRSGEEAMTEALMNASSGPSVVVFRRECPLQVLRSMRKEGRTPAPLRIDQDECTSCLVCIRTGCPAIDLDLTSGKPLIIEEKCTGCTICAQVCPVGAIS